MDNLKTKITTSIAILFLSSLGGIARAESYDFFVDTHSAETQEDGSQQYPFKTINAAMDHIRAEKKKSEKVFINDGTYTESVTLENNTKLFGENKDNTIIDAEEGSVGILFKSTKSTIKDITVKNAGSNIVVDNRSKVTVDSCALRDSRTKGAEIQKGSNSKKYTFEMKNSVVSGSGKYGVFVSRKKIKITDSHIHDNNEEGLDLHSLVKGTVKGNNIENNGESGIELVVGGADLTIQSNDIKNNGAQGIGVQVYSSEKGEVKIIKNTISGNEKYGIKFVRFAKSLKEKFTTFIKKNVSLKRNTIKNNEYGDYNYELN